jgi:hypothetical protein
MYLSCIELFISHSHFVSVVIKTEGWNFNNDFYDMGIKFKNAGPKP